MSKEWTYKPGDWYILCDDCHKKIHGSTAKQRWDGFYVCKDCWNPRHPQDFIKGRKETITPPFTRPRPSDVFVSTCDLWGTQGVAGWGTAGCAVCGFDSQLDNNDVPTSTFNLETL